MVFCCVVKCGSNNVRDRLSFHRLPAVLNYKHNKNLNELSRLRRESWLKAINRADLTESKLKYAFVCSKHFISGKAAKLDDQSNIDWVPTLALGYKTSNQSYKSKRAAPKNKTALKRKKEEDQFALEDKSTNTNMKHDKAVQTEISAESLRQMMHSADTIDELKAKVVMLETLLQERIEIHVLKH